MGACQARSMASAIDGDILLLIVGTGNCTGGHVPLCKPRLSWDHGVGAYGVHERELLVHFFYGVRG